MISAGWRNCSKWAHSVDDPGGRGCSRRLGTSGCKASSPRSAYLDPAISKQPSDRGNGGYARGVISRFYSPGCAEAPSAPVEDCDRRAADPSDPQAAAEGV